MSFWSWHTCLHSPSTSWTSVVSLVGTAPWGLSPWRAWSSPWRGSPNTPRGPGSCALMMTVPALQVLQGRHVTSQSSFSLLDRPQSVGFVHTTCYVFRATLRKSSIHRLKAGFPFDLISSTLTLGFHHIRVHAPGATESATVRNNFSCMICGSPLKEDVKFRVLGGERDASECQMSLRTYELATGFKENGTVMI